LPFASALQIFLAGQIDFRDEGGFESCMAKLVSSTPRAKFFQARQLISFLNGSQLPAPKAA
jgi:hypothetical protein